MNRPVHSEQIKKLIKGHERMWCNMNACLIFHPIMVDKYVFVFTFTTRYRVFDSVTVPP